MVFTQPRDLTAGDQAVLALNTGEVVQGRIVTAGTTHLIVHAPTSGDPPERRVPHDAVNWASRQLRRTSLFSALIGRA